MKKLLATLSQKWPEYLIEAIVIIASILGAFALDNWNEHRKDAVRLENLLISFREELISNMEFTQYLLEQYNTPIVNRMDSLLRDQYQLDDASTALKVANAVSLFPPAVFKTPILDELLEDDAIKNKHEILGAARSLKLRVGELQFAQNFLDQSWINPGSMK